MLYVLQEHVFRKKGKWECDTHSMYQSIKKIKPKLILKTT